jgi:hypothetical protein
VAPSALAITEECAAGTFLDESPVTLRDEEIASTPQSTSSERRVIPPPPPVMTFDTLPSAMWPVEAPEIEEELSEVDARCMAKMRPDVRARRARLTRFVSVWTVACAAFFVVGLVKHGLAHGHPTKVLVVTAGQRLSGPAAVPPLAPGAPGNDAGGGTLLSPVTEPVAATTAEEAATDRRIKAATAKRELRSLLERGAYGAAVSAGERAEALDPADAEVWLMAGAACLAVGRDRDAHRAFERCVSEAEWGTTGECRAMMR